MDFLEDSARVLAKRILPGRAKRDCTTLSVVAALIKTAKEPEKNIGSLRPSVASAKEGTIFWEKKIFYKIFQKRNSTSFFSISA